MTAPMPPAAALEAPRTPLRAPHEAGSGADLDDPVTQTAFTSWQVGGQGRREALSRLRVTGMYCAACAGIVESALGRVDGVLGIEVNAGTARASLRWDPARVGLSALVQAVQAAGYGLVPDAAAGARVERQREQRQALWRLFVAAFCMMQVMMLATPLYFAAPGDIAADQRHLLNWGAWVFTIPVLLFAAGPFFASAWHQLRQRRIGMDVPVALAIAVTFVASSGAAFDPAGVFGHEVYFDSLTMFVFLILGARTLEQRARHRVVCVLEDGIDRLPAGVQRLGADGALETVAPAQLRRGDRVRVPVGQAFAADGVVLEGCTYVDEALLTGEAEPRRKQPGASVVAGSLNLEAPVSMRVERVGPDTRYEGIVSLMRQALVQRPRWLRVADRVAAPFLWGVLLLAASAAAAWSVIDPSRAVWVAVSVLVVTCPCALSLAAPSALLASAGALARRGLLVQRLDMLEPLARMQRLFVDKTGTLTEDRLELADVAAADGTPITPPQAGHWLARAASLAAWSGHPLSRSLVQAAQPLQAVAWSEVLEQAGAGLSALAPDGTPARLGSARWVGIAERDDGGEDNAGAIDLWYREGALAPVKFGFREKLREGAEAAVAALQRDGVRLTLVSGDRAARARAVALRLGIDEVLGAATPQDKLDALAAAQARGEVVGMLGDGINDAPVLARADVSLAMGQGAPMARQRADAVLLSMRLGDIVDARAVARRTVRIVRQNLGWAVGYNLVCVPLALAGLLPPWLAGLGMASSSLAVVLNALRAGRY